MANQLTYTPRPPYLAQLLMRLLLTQFAVPGNNRNGHLSYPPPYPSTLLRIAVLTQVDMKAAPKKGERFTNLNAQSWISAGQITASQIRVIAKTTSNIRSSTVHRENLKHQPSCKLALGVRHAASACQQLKMQRCERE